MNVKTTSQAVGALAVFFLLLPLFSCNFLNLSYAQNFDNPVDPLVADPSSSSDTLASPVGVGVTAGDSQVTVTWGAVPAATSYKVFYKSGTTASIADTQTTTSMISGVTATITGLANDTQYAFVVVASNASGDSVASVIVTCTPVSNTPVSGTDKTSVNIGLLKAVSGGSFQRDATVSNISTVSSFRMSQYEITRAQFLAIMGADPSDAGLSNGLSDPVQGVSWYQAIAFCNTLSLLEGLSPVYTVVGVDFSTLTYESIPATNDTNWNSAAATLTNNGYRLPTEMEWMWAAMGGASDRSNGYTGAGINTTGYTKGYAGSTETASAQVFVGSYAWYYSNSDGKSHPVGTAGTTGHPNELGLYDMSGNAWEFCWDWYGTYPTGEVTDYRAASGEFCVLRGGGWGSTVGGCTVAYRGYVPPYGDAGFRVVCP